jgi:hypothetical protein
MSESKYAARGIGNGFIPPKMPAEPTHFAPGSEEKILLFRRRIANGEALHHPGDAPYMPR